MRSRNIGEKTEESWNASARMALATPTPTALGPMTRMSGFMDVMGAVSKGFTVADLGGRINEVFDTVWNTGAIVLFVCAVCAVTKAWLWDQFGGKKKR